ncbi:cold shock domain-containing protein [Peribacillus sp. SCS-155]|uniref:cold shock domain-containing protein n=1 Tax=Peribacillus sedimenti TaxID=3115297 RepID=UPI003906BF62
MREIGKIKWFGGENSLGKKLQYGFISRQQSTDLYLHKNQLLCDLKSIYEGVAVTFEIGSHKGKEEAQNVTLLSLEEDIDTLYKLSLHPLNWVWEYSMPQYIKKIDNQEILPFIIKRLQTLTDSKDRDIVLNYLNDKMFLNHYKNLKQYVSLEQAKLRCINFYKTQDSPLIPQVKEKFIQSIKETGLNNWEEIPLKVYKNNPEILNALSNREQTYIPILVKLIENYPELEKNLLEELQRVLTKYSFISDFMWRLVPEHLLKKEPLWLHAPKNVKLPLLDSIQITEENINLLKKWLSEEQSFNSKRYFVESIPEIYQKQKPFIAYLPPKSQVDLLWNEFLESPLHVWRIFTKYARVLSLYRVAKEGKTLDFDSLIKMGESEKELQIKALLLLLWGKHQDENKKIKVFNTAHDYIQKDILSQAINTTGPINILRLLPSCYQAVVTYCEGKPWLTQEQVSNGIKKGDRAYCPRTRGSCSTVECNHYTIHDFSFGYRNSTKQQITNDWTINRKNSAQIYSDLQNNWEDWSLLEYLNYCQITPVITGLKQPHQYVNRLAGWINRINEIRARLKCTTCNQIMKNNFEYSKNLAAYSMTIASCTYGFHHDQNVYLNHCWGCNSLIDSRESKIQKDGFYLCITCGSGPRESNSYRHGDICPKCGNNCMNKSSKDNRSFICGKCNHSIKIPTRF